MVSCFSVSSASTKFKTFNETLDILQNHYKEMCIDIELFS